MKISFLVNDYMLAWNLLFQASISESVHKLKQKLWVTYRSQYGEMKHDYYYILEDQKAFIPDDDTLYNYIFESDIFLPLKKGAEKHRLYLLKLWDERKKEINKILKELLRFEIKSEYNILVLHPVLDAVEYIPKKEITTFAIGKKEDVNDENKALINLIYYILKNEFANYKSEYKEIVQAVLELVINNELYTRISGESHYLEGDPTLKFLKRQIYPYWLMYMGANKADMLNYMMRDKIVFDVDKYTIETQLTKVDLYTFMDFCIKNQRYILKINELEL